MTSTITALPRTRVEFDRDVEELLDTGNDDTDYTGWWCVATDPWPCPAPACEFVAHHFTAAHRIVVWPEQDDPMLLQICEHGLKVAKRNPRIIPYETAMGACIPYHLWEALGKPVHAYKRTP